MSRPGPEIRAARCWSIPVVNDQDEVLAAFSVYYTTAKAPTDAEMDIFERIASLVTIIIESKKAEEDLVSVTKDIPWRPKPPMTPSGIAIFVQDSASGGKDFTCNSVINPAQSSVPENSGKRISIPVTVTASSKGWIVSGKTERKTFGWKNTGSKKSDGSYALISTAVPGL